MNNPNIPAIPPGITKPKVPIKPLSPYEVLLTPEKFDKMPSMYRKMIPFITSMFVAFTAASVKFTVPILEAAINFLTSWSKLPRLLDWHDINIELKIKRNMSDDSLQTLQHLYDKDSILATPLYALYYFMSTLSKLAGNLKLIQAKGIQEANRIDKVNLASPEHVLIAQIRGDIDAMDAGEHLGRLGIDPTVTKIYQAVIRQYTDAATITSALIRDEITGAEADDLLDNMNVTNEARKAIVGAMKQIAPDDILIQNVYRDKLSESDFNKELSRKGYDTKQQKFYDNVLDRIPPIQDIITMAVREAFSEAKVKEFQYDEDYPVEFGQWAEKQGFSDSWARKYWYAHWQLPSPQMVFEMLHRRVITSDVVDRYLIIADYPKYWRDKMKQISYRVLSRVDVRRMYQLGVFDDIPGMTPEDAVKETYLDLGYSPKDAALMTRFTVAFYGEERKKLTESKVRMLYMKDILRETDARDYLKELNYRDEYIDLLLESWNFDIEADILDSLINKLRTLYLNGEIDKIDVRAELETETSIPVDMVNLFKVWDYDKAARRRLPNSRDIKGWVENGIIQAWDGVIKLYQLGYSLDDAKHYIHEITGDEPKGKQP
jgi:DNA-dependent RNA polymerase auxiliary subunit epsilon|tara:strand:- start:1525 stop:3333 length:1809 start_codon:yes stop_codon:yes gene_type:complete